MSFLKKINSRYLKIVCCIFFISAQPPGASEYNIKAVFLFNFSQFIEWPPTSFSSPQAPFVIGILGKDPFGSYLDETIAGENIKGHPLIIQRYSSSEKIGACHILFITEKETDKLDEVMTKIKGKSILTVSDADGFLNDGGMIRLYKQKDKIHMQINPDATKQSELVVSSKLLRLAEIITPDKK